MAVGEIERRKGRRARGRSRLHETSIEIEIPFHDVDAMRIVWHGHFFKYLELARTALFSSRGLEAHQFVEAPWRLLVGESQCRHLAPLRYGDRARVSAWFRDFRYRIFIEYEIVNQKTGERVARAYTMLVATDREGRLLFRTPEALVARLDGEGAAP